MSATRTDQPDIDILRTALTGDAHLPGTPEYDTAGQAWNLTVHQRPALVVEAADARDVAMAIDHARRHGLRVAPQGTGHGAASLGDLSGTLLLRTGRMRSIAVDPVARRARVGAGALWDEVVFSCEGAGLTPLAGSSSDVGVAGYALGGGIGWLARLHGLASNSITAVELVTADGRVRRVDARHEPDLFWAVRGGGGNFGVVTAIELELFPITEVFAGMTVWPASQAREVLSAWAAWCRTAPDAATTSFRILRPPALPEVPEPLRDTPIVVIDGAVLADAPQAGAMLAPLRGVGTPMVDTWTTMSPAGLIEIHMDPPGPVPASGDTAILEDLDAAGIDAFLAAIDPDVVTPLLMAELRQLGGALGRTPQGAGARDRFEGAFLLFAAGMPVTPEVTAALHERLARVVAAMRPWSTGTVYLNFAEGGGEAANAYGDGVYARLREVRGAWDPQERFMASHRIAAE